MVLSFLSFFRLSHISPCRCITSAALLRDLIGWVLGRRRDIADSAFFFGGLPIWPGFLLLINIELAFPKHSIVEELLHDTSIYACEEAWAGLGTW